MSNDRNSNLSLYLAKVEGTAGTDAAPTQAVNAIELVEQFAPTWEPAYQNARSTAVKGPSLDPAKPLPPAGKVLAWTKRAWWRGTTGAPTAANPHELDAWLQAMGFAVAYDASAGAEKATYTLANTGLKTMTEWVYHDGKLRKGVGCRAEGSFSFDAGGPLIVECASQGIVTSETDVAVPTDAVFRTTVPPVATDMSTLSVDGYSAGVIRHMEFKTGNSMSRRSGAASAGGVAGFRVDRRAASFSVTLEEGLVADKDWRALQASGADVALAFLLGGTQYNKCDYASAGAVIETVTPSDDNGLSLVTISGGLYGAAPMTLVLK